MIDWRRLADGTLVYETQRTALDDERFERIARGFGDHYVIEWRTSDALGFARGEGYTRLQRWDAFGYVDRGMVERVGNAELALPEIGDNIAVLHPGFRALRFTLNMRVILVFWACLFALFWLLADRSYPALWVAAFFAIYALHVWLVIRSLDVKLAAWLARERWH